MPYITATEIKWRLREGKRTLEKLHSDMCNAPLEDVSKELARELTDILIDLNNFWGKIVELEKEKAQTTVSEIPSRNAVTNRQCNNCWSYLSQQNKFCPECGREIVTSKESD